MSDALIYVLFIAAGFAIGGAYSMWTVNKFASGVLLALAIIAAAGGVLRLI
ncbi:hypothetical protein [Rhodococcus oryzae]|uniref:hypothetical protein n=1 Tax=Rhodococcus oryzae TaxID=2571143 RepID=UPI00145F9C7B|nr:hypothetical protein [Rhodococcus oryzae]